MTAFYNEHEPYAAAWLSNLSQAGHIANGTIDARSIKDVQPGDLAGFTQAHFFAGIGVWSYALRLAGWPDGLAVWTGSCPCQPFSGAGKGEGFSDPRHLWPEWFRLIEKCRPPTILGEQVAGPDGLAWLDLVSSDLEGSGYSFGAAVLPAAGVGAPHQRHRIYFVAHADGGSCGQGSQDARGGDPRGDAEPRSGLGCGGGPDRLADPDAAGWSEQWSSGLPAKPNAPHGHDADGCGQAGELDNPLLSRGGRDGRADDCSEEAGAGAGRSTRGVGRGPSDSGAVGELGHTGNEGLEGRGSGVRVGLGDAGGGGGEVSPGRSSVSGFWANAEWLPCRDGKLRPVEPGSFPLAHGASSRVGRLRAYGNGLCGPLAATFIQAVMAARAAERGGRG